MTRYQVADLFSGCGGFSLGFSTEAMFNVSVAVDFWQQALDTLNANLPSTRCIAADLSAADQVDVVVNELGKDIDVLLGGPPCQGFSTLGKRRDGDRRSTLVDVFADVARRTRPKFIVVENVRGITTKQHPVYSSYATALMEQLKAGGDQGYDCTAGVLNASDYGVAQNRLRWFMIAVRRDLPRAESVVAEFWQRLLQRKVRSPRSLRSAIGDLPKVRAGEAVTELISKKNGTKRLPLYNHRAMRHSADLIARLESIPQGGGLPDVPPHLLTPHLRKMLMGGYGSGGHVKNIYGRMDWDKPSGTIVAGIDKITCGRFVHPEDHRLLTPRECARIQSFPDEFQFLGGQVAQYYQVGNAVPPVMGRILAATIGSFLEEMLSSKVAEPKRLEAAA